MRECGSGYNASRTKGQKAGKLSIALKSSHGADKKPSARLSKTFSDLDQHMVLWLRYERAFFF
jgi:hypothetical protein